MYKIIPFSEFRNTDKVKFYDIPVIENIKALTNVIHAPNAQSPGTIGDVKSPWYMHPHQEDNLIVLTGKRIVELYDNTTKQVVKFEVTPEYIKKDDVIVQEGPAIMHWDTNVFHRVTSGEDGSTNINFAVRGPLFDIETNFNIYDLNLETGEATVIRKGSLDQN